MLLRCYIGRSGEQEWPEWSDEQLISKARHDLRELLGLEAEPLFTEVTRLMHSMPQYPVVIWSRSHSSVKSLLQLCLKSLSRVRGFMEWVCLTV